MDERELLERAAKVAGVFITKEQFEKECTSPWDPEWEPAYCEDAGSIKGWRTWYGSQGEIGGWEGYEWDPLNDEMEAFRLAAKCGFTVEFLTGVVRSPRGVILAVSEVDVKLAIVRAAAVLAGED